MQKFIFLQNFFQNTIELKITQDTKNITVNLRELVKIDDESISVNCDG